MAALTELRLLEDLTYCLRLIRNRRFSRIFHFQANVTTIESIGHSGRSQKNEVFRARANDGSSWISGLIFFWTQNVVPHPSEDTLSVETRQSGGLSISGEERDSAPGALPSYTVPRRNTPLGWMCRDDLYSMSRVRGALLCSPVQ
ncbi:hypothetical protein FRC20_004800 [Serendipita sp. 405]|nr:hypothetical protein FRC15_004328 [Serendipita sp. 397]KAG8776286.1 hypothetical protein FRC16_004561 [Serendipita sp. 398]KAG8810410.1 hypothetical protein FRC18_004075 [Serendipita sp. 400]KAG8841847.1 hypothetical protein FRC20_004800 [Serendipita sp. 405]